jgi:hypothetical protein
MLLLLLYINLRTVQLYTNGKEMVASIRNEIKFQVLVFKKTHNIQSQKNNTENKWWIGQCKVHINSTIENLCVISRAIKEKAYIYWCLLTATLTVLKVWITCTVGWSHCGRKDAVRTPKFLMGYSSFSPWSQMKWSFFFFLHLTSFNNSWFFKLLRFLFFFSFANPFHDAHYLYLIINR